MKKLVLILLILIPSNTLRNASLFPIFFMDFSSLLFFFFDIYSYLFFSSFLFQFFFVIIIFAGFLFYVLYCLGDNDDFDILFDIFVGFGLLSN